MPHLKELVEELSDDSVVFISITDESSEVIKKFINKRRMPGWVGVDSDGSVFKSYGVTGRPRTFVVDAKGNVAIDTASHLLTAEMIRSVIRGETRTAAKKETPPATTSSLPVLGGFAPGYDPYMMPWVYARKVTNGPGYQTVLRPSCIKTSAGYGHSFQRGAVGVTAVGQTPVDLIVFAYKLTSKYRVVDDAKVGEALFDLVYSRPRDSTLDIAWSDIRKLINEYFQIEVSSFKESREVWLVKLDHEQLAAKDEQDWRNDPSVKTLKSVEMFLQRYESSTGNIVECEENAANWFIDVFEDKWYEHEGEDFRKWLETKGVNFQKETREVELWRLQKALTNSLSR